MVVVVEAVWWQESAGVVGSVHNNKTGSDIYVCSTSGPHVLIKV